MRFHTQLLNRLLVGYLVTSSSVAQGLMTTDNTPGFVAFEQNTIQWITNSEEPEVQFALLLGNPQEPGPLIVRVKLPANYKVNPHTHPEARTYTVLGGEWRLGIGERFITEELHSFPKNSAYRLSAKTPHFQMAGPEGATIQIESIGPTTINFIDQ